MSDDFEKKLGQVWRTLGEWTPPPLESGMRQRLAGLPRSSAAPAFTLLWQLAGRAGETLLEVGDMVGAMLAPAPSALLRGGVDAQAGAQALECRLGDAVLKVHIAPDGRGDGELRISVSLEGAGQGNFNIELIDAEADDILESRPLRQSTSIALRDGGLYSLAVIKDSTEVGRVRFKLDKRGPDGKTPC